MRIRVENPKGVEKGVARVVLDGVEVPGILIPASKLRDVSDVVVTMG